MRKLSIKNLNWENAIWGFVFVSFIITVIYLMVMIFRAPTESESSIVRIKSNYLLMLVQCVLGIIAMLLPGLLEHRVKLIIPSRMIILYALFLYCAIYLGEVRNFYYEVPYWDNILHSFSGGMLSTLGFSIIVLLNNTDRIPVNLSPIFIALFTLCFAVALGALWEIYEYTFDGLFGLNMQKYALEDGTLLAGHAALADTMQDLIVDTVSSLIISFIGFLSLKYKKGWVERLILKMHG